MAEKPPTIKYGRKQIGGIFNPLIAIITLMILLVILIYPSIWIGDYLNTSPLLIGAAIVIILGMIGILKLNIAASIQGPKRRKR